MLFSHVALLFAAVTAATPLEPIAPNLNLRSFTLPDISGLYMSTSGTFNRTAFTEITPEHCKADCLPTYNIAEACYLHMEETCKQVCRRMTRVTFNNCKVCLHEAFGPLNQSPPMETFNIKVQCSSGQQAAPIAAAIMVPAVVLGVILAM